MTFTQALTLERKWAKHASFAKPNLTNGASFFNQYSQCTKSTRRTFIKKSVYKTNFSLILKEADQK